MKIKGRSIPWALKEYFFANLITGLIGFSILMPLVVYVLGPTIVYLLHGIPMEVSYARSISGVKLFIFCITISIWVSFILWLGEFIS